MQTLRNDLKNNKIYTVSKAVNSLRKKVGNDVYGGFFNDRIELLKKAETEGYEPGFVKRVKSHIFGTFSSKKDERPVAARNRLLEIVEALEALEDDINFKRLTLTEQDIARQNFRNLLNGMCIGYVKTKPTARDVVIFLMCFLVIVGVLAFVSFAPMLASTFLVGAILTTFTVPALVAGVLKFRTIYNAMSHNYFSDTKGVIRGLSSFQIDYFQDIAIAFTCNLNAVKFTPNKNYKKKIEEKKKTRDQAWLKRNKRKESMASGERRLNFALRNMIDQAGTKNIRFDFVRPEEQNLPEKTMGEAVQRLERMMQVINNAKVAKVTSAILEEMKNKLWERLKEQLEKESQTGYTPKNELVDKGKEKLWANQTKTQMILLIYHAQKLQEARNFVDENLKSASKSEMKTCIDTIRKLYNLEQEPSLGQIYTEIALRYADKMADSESHREGYDKIMENFKSFAKKASLENVDESETSFNTTNTNQFIIETTNLNMSDIIIPDKTPSTIGQIQNGNSEETSSATKKKRRKSKFINRLLQLKPLRKRNKVVLYHTHIQEGPIHERGILLIAANSIVSPDEDLNLENKDLNPENAIDSKVNDNSGKASNGCMKAGIILENEQIENYTEVEAEDGDLLANADQSSINIDRAQSSGSSNAQTIEAKETSKPFNETGAMRELRIRMEKFKSGAAMLALEALLKDTTLSNDKRKKIENLQRSVKDFDSIVTDIQNTELLRAIKRNNLSKDGIGMVEMEELNTLRKATLQKKVKYKIDKLDSTLHNLKTLYSSDKVAHGGPSYDNIEPEVGEIRHGLADLLDQVNKKSNVKLITIDPALTNQER